MQLIFKGSLAHFHIVNNWKLNRALWKDASKKTGWEEKNENVTKPLLKIIYFLVSVSKSAVPDCWIVGVAHQLSEEIYTCILFFFFNPDRLHTSCLMSHWNPDIIELETEPPLLRSILHTPTWIPPRTPADFIINKNTFYFVSPNVNRCAQERWARSRKLSSRWRYAASSVTFDLSDGGREGCRKCSSALNT